MDEIETIRRWASKSILAHKYRKHKRYSINVSLEEIVELAQHSQRCTLCGIDLDFTVGKGSKRSNSPTIDRIDNGSVSSIGDMQIVCWDCNAMKSNKPFKLFLQKCANITVIARRRGLI